MEPNNARALFEGEGGKWLAFECLPAYLIIFIIWPYNLIFVPSSREHFGRNFVQVFSGGDLVAASICFLIAALVKVIPSEKDSSRDWRTAGIVLGTLLILLFLYVGMRAHPIEFNPGSVDSFPENSILFCLFGWLGAALTSAFLYSVHRKTI
jgi:hypothetical protein